jgi:hypothetical protein
LVTAIIAVVIVGLGFFFGSSNRDSVSGVGWAAKVDGETIKMGEFLNRYRAVVDNYRAKLGANFDEKLLEQLNIRSYILKNIVDEKLAAKEALNNGLGVSDYQLRDNIQQYPAFQKNGAFSMDYYKQLLSYNRIKPVEFERMQREEMLRQKLRMLIYTSSKASDEEVLTAYRTENEKETLAFVPVDTSSTPSNISAEDVNKFLSTASGKKEAQDYYTKHNDEFRLPAHGKKEATIRLFNDVKEEIARNILLKKKEANFYDTKIDNALKMNSIEAAAKALGQKVQYTGSFTRKASSVPAMPATNLNDVIWAFSINKGKIYKRETNGKTYIVALKEKAFKSLNTKDKAFEDYKQKFISDRGGSEYMNYMKSLDKKWSKKIEYSPYLLKDMRGMKESL